MIVRAHRDTAAVFLAAGLAAFAVATGLRWNPDALVSVPVGTAVFVALMLLHTRRTGTPAPPSRAVRTALVAVAAAAVATLAVSALWHGDGWGVLATVLLGFGAVHLWWAASCPALGLGERG